MIDLHYCPTPDGCKVAMFLEETALPYRLVPEHTGRMPAIVDHRPIDGGPPISVAESGAILLYLADKSEQFLPADIRGRTEVIEWLFWQMGKESMDSHGVLDRRLGTREFLAGAYSIADMAAYPWVVSRETKGRHLANFPHLKRWIEAVKARPATVRAYELAPALSGDH